MESVLNLLLNFPLIYHGLCFHNFVLAQWKCAEVNARVMK
jgi:hypothetical protein